MPSIDTEIAIIGAGAAGIAAAWTARTYGLSYRLIEARSRVGGRAHTATTPAGQPFDVGASWLHAVDQGNPTAELAIAQGARPVLDRRRRVLLDAGGGIADAASRSAFEAAKAAATARIDAAPPNSSLADCLATHDDPWWQTQRAFAGPWLSGTDCADTDAADWASARSGDDWLLPEGYGRLVQGLAHGLDVTLQCPLEAIEALPHGLRVSTSQGSFVAAHVVLTVPLGVLAAERIRFTPALPASFAAALECLPMGRLMKVAIDLLADPLGESGTYFLHYPAADEAAVLYQLRPCGHRLAYAFVGGSLARSLEAEPDFVVRDAVLDPLRRLLGAAVVERSFADALATRWAGDPFALGSYAVARPGGAAARTVLAKPVFERLHLTGEATAPDGWHGTVGGAWLAGRQAVARIAAMLRHVGPNAAETGPATCSHD